MYSCEEGSGWLSGRVLDLGCEGPYLETPDMTKNC